MSIEKLVDILKIIAPFIIILGTLFVYFYNMYFKVKTIKDYEKIFLRKDDVQKINFIDTLFNYLLFMIGMYIVPAGCFGIAYKEFNFGISQYFKNILVLPLLLILNIFLLSLVYCIVFATFFNTLKKPKYKKLNITITTISLISSCILYYFMFYDVVFTNQSKELISIIIFFPILLSLLYLYIFNFYKKRMINEYTVQTIDKKDLDKLQLIQSHMIDDGKALLYEKNNSIEDMFYICDFSSKVYLKYEKRKLYQTSTNKPISDKK